MQIFSALILLALSALIAAEVTVLKATQYIYDKSPKLRIRGTGFDADDHNIVLDLGVNGQAPLTVDKDYMITKDADGDGIILKLLGNRKWADLSKRVPPVAMILSGVRFSTDPAKKNLLNDPVIVAQVLNTPTVQENRDIIYTSATNELRINGTGFIGSKEVDFYFKPPLVKEVAYEDVTPYPLVKDEIILRLRHGYTWRDEPGPLFVIGVDTGGGPVKVSGDDGVVVSEVQANLDLHGVSVDASDQLLYADDANVLISGEGFNPVGNTLRWANGLLGNGVNYTTVSTSETSIAIRLVPGSYWRKNFENLPGTLTLLAVNAGQGFVAVGPTNAAKGRDIATIFERPAVYSDNKKVYRTHSHELHIKGTGFPLPATGYKVQLKFDPPMGASDYSVRVVERGDLEVTLLDGRAWRETPGPLVVTAINTRGDDAGWVKLPGDGVHVAEILEDIDAQQTGGVEVFPMGEKVYQSALQEQIQITGTGFKDGMAFTFDPALKAGTDYDLDVKSKNRVIIRLRNGKKWRQEPGFIVAKSIKIDGQVYPLAGQDGIRVAVVLADPVITASKDTYHESQSKLVVISGSGFTNVADTKITLRPTSPGAYKVLGVLEDAIRLQLKADQDWLPSFMSLKDEEDGKKIILQVSSIDTGAGDIVFDEPITVGYIIKDREGVVCDDSCEFAFDGVCDDGTEPNDQYYYQNYNKYMDDDFGGFYDEPEDVDGDGVAYGVAYDDYYMENEDYAVSACVEGTDCTDCGGVDAIIDYSKPLDPESGFESCTNTCMYPRDGVCDDPRGTKYCELGTDCQDCGPVGADNFTRADDDGWWDDDDDYWTFNDGNFIDQAKGLEYNRHHVKVFNRQDTAGPAAMFLVVLEGMVYTVGAIFAAAALYLLNRWYKGQSVPFMNAFNPETAATSREFEMRPHQRMPITPDEFRT